METSTSGELTKFLRARMVKYQTSEVIGARSLAVAPGISTTT